MLLKRYARNLGHMLSPKFEFSVYTNQYHLPKEILPNGKEVLYDHNLSQNTQCIQAFLQKRRLQKSEIPPQIYIIDTLPQLKNLASIQQLIELKQLLTLDRLQQMEEAQQISSSFVLSVSLEEHFKPMMDEYLKQIVVNGQMPPMNQYAEYNQIQLSIIELYRAFFFGEQLTNMEKEIQFRYLAEKQQKFFKYAQKNKGAYKCQWTFSNQRRVQMMRNWRARDLELYDDFCPLWEPLMIDERKRVVLDMLEINGASIWSRLYHHTIENRYFRQNTKRADWVSQIIMTRAMLYTTSMEFNQLLSIPPDFHIEHSILNMHIWMVVDRLQQINTHISQYQSRDLEYKFRLYTLQRINRIHLRKKNDFIKDVNHFMGANRKAFDNHFNINPKTAGNPTHKIDALVWSSIFFEQVPRYSDEVYMMSDYFLHHYNYLSKLDFETIEDCLIEWDVYQIDIDFKKQIQAANPQLSEQEFIEEFNSDQQQQKYYYSYDEESDFLPIEKEKQEKLGKIDAAQNSMFHSLFASIRKFQNQQTYDYYNQREEETQNQKLQNQKYIWEGEQQQRIEIIDANEIKQTMMKRKAESLSKNTQTQKDEDTK